MIWLVSVSLACGFVVSWATAFVVRRYAARFGLVDQPGKRKVHTHPVPLGGGLAIWAGLVVPFALGEIVIGMVPEDYSESVASGGGAAPVAPNALDTHETKPGEAHWLAPLAQFVAPHVSGLRLRSADLWFFLAGATVLMALGLFDDVRGVDWRLRLAVQTIVAAAVVFGWGWRFTLFIDVPWLTGALSVLWIVGLVNSFNMLDNMDGLAAGVAAICAIMLAAVMLVAPSPLTHQPQLFVAGFLLVLAGSSLGFLWHNRPPARLFMGDAGSYVLGFCLAVTTLLATFAGGDLPKHAILAPLCVLAVPLYDTITVVWIRLRAGRSPFEGDTNHFSHRLVELGLSKSQAVLTIYLTTAACGLGALVLHQVNVAGAVMIVLLVGCLLAVIAILETTARRKMQPAKASGDGEPRPLKPR